MIATAVLIMLVGRLTHLAELNINPIYSAFPKPCVYTWGIDVEKVGIDDRRIATGVLY